MEAEKLGLPTVLLISTPFTGLARNQARVLGLPSLPMVVLDHPIAGIALDKVLARLDGALDEIVAKLTTALPLPDVAAITSNRLRSERVEIDLTDAWSALQDDFVRRGWSDGLPLVPPTEARVAAMVGGSGTRGEQVIGEVAPKMGVATVEAIAVNAVMAGCLPEHMPVLVAAVQAMTDPLFNLKTIQATTHPVAPLLIVSGPLAQRLNINGGSGLFGPGPWSNGVIGRAIRLMLLNIGGGRPGEIDKATMGQPGKYSYCIAENEAASPWPSLRAERGFAPEVSTVTVLDAEAPHNVNDHESTTAGGLLTTIAGAMAQTGQNNVYYAGEPLLLLSPEHAATIAGDGFSKDDVKRSLYEDARIPMSRFSRENIERRLWRFLPRRYLNRPADTGVTVAQCQEDIMVIVAGGPGKHSMVVPTCAGSRSVTKPILKPDGRPWLPSDF